MPLRRADGRAVGTLLAMDKKPRAWTASQLDLLEKLSAMMVDELELGAAVRRASQGDVSLESVPVKASSSKTERTANREPVAEPSLDSR